MNKHFKDQYIIGAPISELGNWKVGRWSESDMYVDIDFERVQSVSMGRIRGVERLGNNFQYIQLRMIQCRTNSVASTNMCERDFPEVKNLIRPQL